MPPRPPGTSLGRREELRAGLSPPGVVSGTVTHSPAQPPGSRLGEAARHSACCCPAPSTPLPSPQPPFFLVPRPGRGDIQAEGGWDGRQPFFHQRTGRFRRVPVPGCADGCFYELGICAPFFFFFLR